MLFDRGADIPHTLPKNFKESFVYIVTGNHARLIDAAHTLGRSKSKQRSRGIGLKQDIKRYINVMNADGSYSVRSLCWEYKLEKLRSTD